MVQCCCQYHFTFYFCESLILQIGDFLYFAGTNNFLGLVNLVSPSGNLYLTTAFNHAFINWVTNIGKSTCEIACVHTITKLWLVPSAKQRRDLCSGPPTDSTNYRKCVSNSPSTWLAITTNKTKAFFNWPIVARTQIWVHSWKSRTRISALFRRRS